MPMSCAQGGKDPGPPQHCNRLWQGIRAAAKGWVITTEQTVAGLQGLPQPAERIDDWQRAWDEMTDVHLEGEDQKTDIDAATQRKRPDAWAVSWDKKCLLILEFTRPNDRCALALQNTDTYKTERYPPLRNRLTECLPGWEVGIQTFTVGIRGSYDPDRYLVLQLDPFRTDGGPDRQSHASAGTGSADPHGAHGAVQCEICSAAATP